MRKESKLSRIPAPDETDVGLPLEFLGVKFPVTAPASIQDELTMQWARFVPAFNKLNKNSLAFRTVPKLKEATRKVYQRNSFMLTASDQKWFFNWSLAQKTLEINVAKKMSAAKTRRLGAFAFGVMMYDTGLRAPVKKFFDRKIKQDKVPLDGIMKWLAFFKDGSKLGRARASFGFGFMMHLEQAKPFYNHPLHALVGEVLFDTEGFDVLPSQGYEKQFKIDDYAPLSYDFDPERFELMYKGLTQRQIANRKRIEIGGVPFEDALDETGIAPFTNALKKAVTAVVQNPNHPRHTTVVRGLGLSRASQFDPSKFSVRLSGDHDGSSYLYGYLKYGTRQLCVAKRDGISRDSHSNSLCEIEEPFRKLGAGMHMTASQIEASMRTGKQKITVHAALDGGWRTWNKFGFETNSPILDMNTNGNFRPYCEKSVSAKLEEMGEVDRQEILGKLLQEMISNYNLKFTVMSNPSSTPPPIPPLPADPAADIEKILLWTIAEKSGYSGEMRRMLSGAGLPTDTNTNYIRGWFSSNIVGKQQQQTVHDYFLANRSALSGDFRAKWGYPPALSTSSSRQVTNTQIDGALKNLIETWGYFDGQPFSAQMVRDLVMSAQFDVVHAYTNLPDLMEYMGRGGLLEDSSTLRGARLTPRTQYMQDCMEIEGFADEWTVRGSTSWYGKMDLSEGKYSLAVLAMDRYRKLKIAEKPQLASDPAFQRSRRASILEDLKDFHIDPDLLKGFATSEGSDVNGGISRVDMLLMEQALRDARALKKEIDKALKEQMNEASVRLASRWLGGE